MNTYLFVGTITTRAPLAYSPPDHVAPDKRALLPRMTVPTAAGPLDTVYLSGSTIRGRYRHACADVCLAREKPVTYERYLELTVGGVKGRAAVRRVGLSERGAYVAGEPLLSLFGAGASKVGWIHGRLAVGAALPAEPAEPVVLNGRRGDGTEDPILLEVLGEEERERVLLAAEANQQRSRAAAKVGQLRRQIARANGAEADLSELRRSLEAACQAEEEAASAQSELVGSDVSPLLPLAGYEAIAPGTALSHRMFFRHVSQGEMSLFVAGFARFAEQPRFGGRGAQGCGSVGVEYAVKRLDGVRAHTVGAVSIDPGRWDEDGSSLVLSGEPACWLDAWHDSAS